MVGRHAGTFRHLGTVEGLYLVDTLVATNARGASRPESVQRVAALLITLVPSVALFLFSSSSCAAADGRGKPWPSGRAFGRCC